MEMTLEQVKQIYREAMDPLAKDAEGSDWWASVFANVTGVVRAKSLIDAAEVIQWWHSDWEWNQVADSPLEAAQRIRDAAHAVGSPTA
ncbi:hypothetical protein [Cupriavidus agavae]|uniref:Uncharacterized protein n=1 Tax=Cupriavidus agavae TaxID=1001822 RepID=A0A4Q7RP43_9BURK|nr:hypothetical protein [Cupriavidus agavae]RZT35446.1 hypothetical protein EV147_3887 [Cupriavidus agavae]